MSCITARARSRIRARLYSCQYERPLSFVIPTLSEAKRRNPYLSYVHDLPFLSSRGGRRPDEGSAFSIPKFRFS